ncbi:MAG: ATP synthase F1 subunit epsilon [Eggerthellaceae bacterium]|nr:ATP synthase F1 subunit epsilon [Eggerthellaceae bacterium]
MATLTCDIVTPAECLFSEECYMVAVPGESGHMGFLPGHAPLVSTLADGEVRLFSDSSTLTSRYACQGGYVQVTGEKVIVLADRAVLADDIDASEAASKVTELQAALAAASEDDPQRRVIAYDLKWYQTLQQVASGK